MEYKDIEKVNTEIKKTDIKGKKYAEVSERILAFRKLNPNGRIITEIIDKTENDVTVKATIYDENEKELAQKFYSLKYNYTFLTNILRKSIYEYYINKRWQLKNANNTTNIFKKNTVQSSEFEHLQLDMIISTIENKWVKEDA